MLHLQWELGQQPEFVGHSASSKLDFLGFVMLVVSLYFLKLIVAAHSNRLWVAYKI